MYGSEAPEADPGGPGGGSGGLGSGFTKALSVGVVVTWRLLSEEGTKPPGTTTGASHGKIRNYKGVGPPSDYPESSWRFSGSRKGQNLKDLDKNKTVSMRQVCRTRFWTS